MARLLRLTVVAMMVAAASPLRADPPAKIAATVSGEPITAAEIELALQQVARQPASDSTARATLEATALEQLIGQRLITAFLVKQNPGKLEEQVQAALNMLKLRAETFKVPYEEYLKQRGLDEAALRRQTTWRLGWQAYLEQQLTDARLQACFDAERRDFDGTELRISHILWRHAESNDVQKTQTAIAAAQQVRQQILDGKLSFAEAVTKHSSGPSRDQAGDLGFIPRHGRMDEAFSQAAFRLQAGELSPAVVTPFGVHIIRCTEVRPGAKAWTDVRAALRARVTQQLFEQLAAEQRKTAKIEYTGHTPYFRPESRELVLPK